jgi:hypothetical protein
MRSSHIVRYLLAVSLSVLSITSWSVTDGYEIPELNYIQIENGIEITGCVETCPLWMEIPESIDEYSVTSIGEEAFDNTNIEWVILPDTILVIKSWAFKDSSLRRIKLSRNLKIIEERAFWNSNVRGVVFPESLESIGNYAFHSNDIKEVYFYGDRPSMGDVFSYNYSSIFLYCNDKSGWPGDKIIDSRYGDKTPQLSDKCDTYYAPGQFTYVPYEDGIEITGCTFNYCVKNLVIPDYIDGYPVRSIASRSFPANNSNSSIYSVVLPDTLRNIASNAFIYNTFENVSIPSGVNSIGESAFEYTSITDVFVDDSFDMAKNAAGFRFNPGKTGEGFNYLEFSNQIMVIGCDGICPTDLIIPNQIAGKDVTAIAIRAFENSGLNSVNIPDSVVYLGKASFSSNNITSINLSSQLRSINGFAFDGNLLTEIDLPNLLTIEYGVFRDNQIQSVMIPASVENFSTSAFTNNIHNERPSIIKFLGSKPNFDGFYEELTILFCAKTEGWLIESLDEINDQNVNLLFDEHCDSDGDGITNSFDSSPFLSNQSAQIDESYSFWDIDKNGSVGALTDGLILLRYFFGLRGEGLINGAIDSNGLRTSAADIEAYIESHMP